MLRLNCKSRQLVPPSTAAQGFSPGHSADGSLICSRGGPLCKEPALVENSCSALFSTTVLLTYYFSHRLEKQVAIKPSHFKSFFFKMNFSIKGYRLH